MDLKQDDEISIHAASDSEFEDDDKEQTITIKTPNNSATPEKEIPPTPIEQTNLNIPSLMKIKTSIPMCFLHHFHHHNQQPKHSIQTVLRRQPAQTRATRRANQQPVTTTTPYNSITPENKKLTTLVKPTNSIIPSLLDINTFIPKYFLPNAHGQVSKTLKSNLAKRKLREHHANSTKQHQNDQQHHSRRSGMTSSTRQHQPHQNDQHHHVRRTETERLISNNFVMTSTIENIMRYCRTL